MWKDILFGCASLVFIVSLYRIIFKIGDEKFNIISIGYSGLFGAILANNGFFSFTLSVIIFAAFFRRYIKIIVMLFCIVILAFIMKYPVLRGMNISQAHFVYALSIPLQQLGKIVTDKKEISIEQRKLFEKVVDLSKIPHVYKKHISDPMTALVMQFHNQDYLASHKFAYFKAWVNLGIRYPYEYVKAWVDETRGYWHGGYRYWIWSVGVKKNNLGIKRTVNSQLASMIQDKYLAMFMSNSLLMPFLSIGFNFWILMLIFCSNIINGRKIEAYLAVPAISIIASLMIATPVFSEFRYAYSIFISVPFVLLCSIFGPRCDSRGITFSRRL